MWTKRGKACLILIFSANTNCENMAYRSFRSEKCSARGVRKVTTGMTRKRRVMQAREVPRASQPCLFHLVYLLLWLLCERWSHLDHHNDKIHVCKTTLILMPIAAFWIELCSRAHTPCLVAWASGRNGEACADRRAS